MAQIEIVENGQAGDKDALDASLQKLLQEINCQAGRQLALENADQAETLENTKFLQEMINAVLTNELLQNPDLMATYDRGILMDNVQLQQQLPQNYMTLATKLNYIKLNFRQHIRDAHSKNTQFAKHVVKLVDQRCNDIREKSEDYISSLQQRLSDSMQFDDEEHDVTDDRLYDLAQLGNVPIENVNEYIEKRDREVYRQETAIDRLQMLSKREMARENEKKQKTLEDVQRKYEEEVKHVLASSGVKLPNNGTTAAFIFQTYSQLRS